MQATPLAAAGFIAMVWILHGYGAPAAVVTTCFLLYAPAYLGLLYAQDAIQHRWETRAKARSGDDET